MHAPAAGHGGDVGPRAVLLLGVWCALVTGLLEAAWLGIKVFVLHQQIWLGPNVAWMASVTNVVVFSVPGFVLAFAAHWRRDRPWLRITALAFTSLGALSLLLMLPQLQVYAGVILAIGIGVRASAAIASHASAVLGFVRLSTIPLIGIVLLLAVGVNTRKYWRERRAIGALPAAPASAPNVLLLILDTVRASGLSLYGYARPTTPNLERLSKRGVTFEWAISAAPWTLPSHASMFTGHYSHELGTSWFVPLSSKYPTLAELLSSRGYRTGGFVANTFYCSTEFGLDRGFSHYEDFAITPSEFVLSSHLTRTISNSGRVRSLVGFYDDLGRKSAATVNGDFLRWVSERSNRPFFAFLNYYDAHQPYLPPAPFDTMFGSQDARALHLIDHRQLRNGDRGWRQGMPADEKRAERDAYDGAIAFIDREIGALLDSLDARHVLENTIVIVTSDHGEAFGERGRWGHGNSLHISELHVPLLIVAPGRAPEGRRVQRAVSLRDLGATLHSLLGLEQQRFPGRSFASLWAETAAGDSAWSDTLYAGFDQKAMRTLIAREYQYVIERTGREELFDLRADPAGQRNLAASDSGRQIAQRMKQALLEHLERIAQGATSAPRQ